MQQTLPHLELVTLCGASWIEAGDTSWQRMGESHGDCAWLGGGRGGPPIRDYPTWDTKQSHMTQHQED